MATHDQRRKWYAAFLYVERENPVDPTDFFKRYEFIILPPKSPELFNTFTVYERERRGKGHRSVWKRYSLSEKYLREWFEDKCEKRNVPFSFAKPIIVEVDMNEVIAQIDGTGKDKSPYFVINRVKKIMQKRGAVL